MAYTIDMSKRTIEVGEAPPSRHTRVPEPNPLLDYVKQSYDKDEWLIIRAVPTVDNILVTNPVTKEESKISEVNVIERMLRRGARTLGCGIAISYEPGTKKGQMDVYFLAKEKRARKAKNQE